MLIFLKVISFNFFVESMEGNRRYHASHIVLTLTRHEFFASLILRCIFRYYIVYFIVFLHHLPLASLLSSIMLKISDVIFSFTLFLYPSTFSTALWIAFDVPSLVFYALILFFSLLLSNLMCLSSLFFSISCFPVHHLGDIIYILFLFPFTIRFPLSLSIPITGGGL